MKADSNCKNKCWIIQGVCNGMPCSCCGKVEYPLISGTCDITTNGLRKQFNHLELQFVMDFGAEDITEILNIFANRVSKGEKFKPGQIVEIGNYRYRFDESSYNGESFLRIVITDDNGKFPEDKDCEELHTFQLIKTEDLYFKNQIGGTTND